MGRGHGRGFTLMFTVGHVAGLCLPAHPKKSREGKTGSCLTLWNQTECSCGSEKLHYHQARESIGINWISPVTHECLGSSKHLFKFAAKYGNQSSSELN